MRANSPTNFWQVLLPQLWRAGIDCTCLELRRKAPPTHFLFHCCADYTSSAVLLTASTSSSSSQVFLCVLLCCFLAILFKKPFLCLLRPLSLCFSCLTPLFFPLPSHPNYLSLGHMAYGRDLLKKKSCKAKISLTSNHKLCLLCLDEGYQVESCALCSAFTKQVHKSRAAHLGTLLWRHLLDQLWHKIFRPRLHHLPHQGEIQSNLVAQSLHP